MAATVFCGLCGYQRRRQRSAWFAGFWICSAFACLTKGLLGLVYPATIFLLLSIFYREARLRYRALLRWEHLAIFLLIAAPWHIWAQWKFPGYFHYLIAREWEGHLWGLSDELRDYLGVPAYQFVLMHLAWLFPWSIALLPGVMFAWRRVMLPSRSNFADVPPIWWMGVVSIPHTFIGSRHVY